MHFVLSYDLGAEGQRREEIEEQIRVILNPYQYVRKLTTFFIVHVNNQAESVAIRTTLTDLSQNIPERFHFIMSPMMEGGLYNGILPQNDWIDINQITQLD